MKKWLIGFILLVLLGGGYFLVKSGGIVYYETLRMGNQSSGYLGKKSVLLEDQKQLEQIFLDLEEQFKNQNFHVLAFSINNRRINLVIQDPKQPTYFDNYSYDGTNFVSKWEKGDPYKAEAGTESLPFDELSAAGFYSFYQQIVAYLVAGNYDLDDDLLIQITVAISDRTSDPYLQSYVSGLREDFRFKADLSGNNFESERD